MITYLRKILICFGLGSILVLSSQLVKSSFIDSFLGADLIALLITILAINVASSSIIAVKIQEIEQRINHKFTNTYKEIKGSLVEQLFLIGISVPILILKESKYFHENCHLDIYFYDLINILLLSVFIWFLDILRDTGLVIFDIITFANDKIKKECTRTDDEKDE